MGSPPLDGLDAYELSKTIELDVHLGGEQVTLRIEILRALGAAGTFRARLWRQDLYRLVPSFPRDADDEPTEQTDAAAFVDWAELLDESYDRFEAQSEEAAVARVLADLRRAVAAAQWTR